MQVLIIRLLLLNHLLAHRRLIKTVLSGTGHVLSIFGLGLVRLCILVTVITSWMLMNDVIFNDTTGTVFPRQLLPLRLIVLDSV